MSREATFCLLAASMLSVPAISQARLSVPIDVTVPWNDTGISIAAGDDLTISSSGTFNWGQNCTSNCTASPNGEPWSNCKNDTLTFSAPGLSCWSLVGKIGENGAPFEVGTSITIEGPASGELYLGINDNYYQDNSGSLTATISSSESAIDATPGVSLYGSAITVAPGATTGNTSILTVVPRGGFIGSVDLSATVAPNGAGTASLPSASFGGSAQVTIGGTNLETTTLTVTTAAPGAGCSSPTTKQAKVRVFLGGGSIAMCIMLLGIPTRRRTRRRWFGLFALSFVFVSVMSSCGGASCNPGTTPGTYTVTVTGASSAATAKTSIAITVE
jgi:hypothetical protein